MREYFGWYFTRVAAGDAVVIGFTILVAFASAMHLFRRYIKWKLWREDQEWEMRKAERKREE